MIILYGMSVSILLCIMYNANDLHRSRLILENRQWRDLTFSGNAHILDRSKVSCCEHVPEMKTVVDPIQTGCFKFINFYCFNVFFSLKIWSAFDRIIEIGKKFTT